MMTCREFETFIHDYLDEELAFRQRIVFRMHLLVCKECRSYLRKYKLSRDLGKRVFEEPGEPVTGDVPEELVAAILAAARKSP